MAQGFDKPQPPERWWASSSAASAGPAANHGRRLEHLGVLTGDEQEQSDAVLYRRQRVEGERKAVER
jgi:hypothetical protein